MFTPRVQRLIANKENHIVQMDTNTYLDTFENKLYEELVKLCGSYIVIDGLMPSSQDIEEHWKELAPEYLHDAIPQISDYPTVSIAWAGYLGIAVANDWDSNWELLRNRPYKEFYGVQGFDDMDENIVYNILGLAPSSKEAADIEAMMRRLAQQALTLLRHENIEPQSPSAFYAYTRVVNVMYRIGASLELMRLGYICQKIDLPVC